MNNNNVPAQPPVDVNSYFFEIAHDMVFVDVDSGVAIQLLLLQLRDGNLATLKVLAPVYSRKFVTMSWIHSVYRDVPMSRIKEGVDFLISTKRFQFDPYGYEIQTPGSRPHQLLLYLIKSRVVTPEEIEELIQVNPTMNENLKYSLRGQVQQQNILRNIPGAAKNRETRQVLRNRLNMNNRGPINIVSQMMGAPAVVRRARKTRRRN